jgi:hypothetical protein
MICRPVMIVHERVSVWGLQLRPRYAGGITRYVETRSTSDLESALRLGPCPIIVITLGERLTPALIDVQTVAREAPDALILVHDATARPGVAETARELGATVAVSGFIPPPRVVELLERWILIARRRAETAGWLAGVEPASEPWGQLPLDDLTAHTS